MDDLEKITYDLALYGERLSNEVYNTATKLALLDDNLEGDEAKRLYDLVNTFDKVFLKYIDWKNKPHKMSIESRQIK